jgi:cyclopropane-fatty-acyl-phospholipid synthase
MIYPCAYFVTGAENLEKLDHISKKLRLAPGERLLDIGCGWGGLLIWAAGHYGISGVGVTLSRPQAELARKRAAEAGQAQRLEFRVEDYRDIAGEGEFDKIVSVGMYEHVGLANLPRYFAAMARLLKPGSLMLNHGITAADRDGRAHGPQGGEFIDRFVFPGGEVPHISREAPDAVTLDAGGGDRCLARGFEAAHPMHEGRRAVRAQILDVENFQAGAGDLVERRG